MQVRERDSELPSASSARNVAACITVAGRAATGSKASVRQLNGVSCLLL
jgi:hypothetical protein